MEAFGVIGVAARDKVTKRPSSKSRSLKHDELLPGTRPRLNLHRRRKAARLLFRRDSFVLLEAIVEEHERRPSNVKLVLALLAHDELDEVLVRRVVVGVCN